MVPFTASKDPGTGKAVRGEPETVPKVQVELIQVVRGIPTVAVCP